MLSCPLQGLSMPTYVLRKKLISFASYIETSHLKRPVNVYSSSQKGGDSCTIYWKCELTSMQVVGCEVSYNYSSANGTISKAACYNSTSAGIFVTFVALELSVPCSTNISYTVTPYYVESNGDKQYLQCSYSGSLTTPDGKL